MIVPPGIGTIEPTALVIASRWAAASACAEAVACSWRACSMSARACRGGLRLAVRHVGRAGRALPRADRARERAELGAGALEPALDGLERGARRAQRVGLAVGDRDAGVRLAHQPRPAGIADASVAV
jgi:hypothetical protein